MSIALLIITLERKLALRRSHLKNALERGSCRQGVPRPAALRHPDEGPTPARRCVGHPDATHAPRKLFFEMASRGG